MNNDSSQFPPFGALKSEWDRWCKALDPVEWILWASWLINNVDPDALSFDDLRLMCDLIDRRDEKLAQLPAGETIN
jgi:hypothetical protein